ncbi:MAG: hypothetical protein LBC62_05510 [Treponema sp.]|jgi:hypothetical protein|nr:hypothetical protein [Treponema sp.]
MKLSRLLRFLLAALILSPALHAQEEADLSQPLFVPFVSRLQGEIKNNLLRLSWTDSPDVRGPVYIYRSLEPFDDNLSPDSLGRPVEVPYGAESYIDELGDPGTYYYFVVASDTRGQHFVLPIPLNNSISVQISASPGGLAVSTGSPVSGGFPVPGEAAPVPGGSEPGISGLEAVTEGDGIIITFSAGMTGKKVVLYRSVQPIRQTMDLLGAVIVHNDAPSPLTDYPVPGIPYYYAAILEEDLTRGTAGIYPGKNATVNSVEVPAGQGRIGLAGPDRDIRAMPLPMISVTAAVPATDAFGETPVQAGLSAKAAKALEDVPVSRKQAVPEKQPRVFSRDVDDSPRGEDYALRAVVQGSFANRDWEACRDELKRYLSLPRSGESEARARFYLGQCYYFLGQFREGLFEFLSARPFYPEESPEWIQASLNALVSAGS